MLMAAFLQLWVALHRTTRERHDSAVDKLNEMKNFVVDPMLKQLRATTRMMRGQPSARYKEIYDLEVARILNLFEETTEKVEHWSAEEQNINSRVGQWIDCAFLKRPEMFIQWAKLTYDKEEPRVIAMQNLVQLLFTRFRESIFSVYALKVKKELWDTQVDTIIQEMEKMNPDIFTEARAVPPDRGSQVSLTPVPPTDIEAPQGIMLKIFMAAYEELREVSADMETMLENTTTPVDVSKVNRFKALMDENSRLATSIDSNMRNLQTNAQTADVDEYLVMRRGWRGTKLDAIEILSRLEDRRRSHEDDMKSQRIVLEKSLPHQKLVRFDSNREIF